MKADQKEQALNSLDVPAARWAVHLAHSYLKLVFEPILSRACIHLDQTANYPLLAAGQEAACFSTSRRLARTLQPQENHLDTLQICNKLLQWCVEGGEQIQDLFQWSSLISDGTSVEDHTSAENPQEILDSIYGQKDSSNAEDLCEHTRHISLCKFVQQHTELIAEFRRIVAHDLLSVTQSECAAVLASTKTLLSCLKTAWLSPEDIIAPAHEFNGLHIQKWSKSKVVHLSLHDSEAKLFMCMEALFSLEDTLVRLCRSLSAEHQQLPMEVGCAGTLCALLRNESWQKKVIDVLKADPKPLTVKAFVYSEHRKLFMDFCSSSRSSLRGLKAYSHLEIVYMARNMFNHASFEDVSLDIVSQWLHSTIIMIANFSIGQRDFTKVLCRLEKLREAVIFKEANSTLNILLKEDGSSAEDEMSSRLGKCSKSSSEGQWKETGRDVAVRLMKSGPSKGFVGRQKLLDRIEQKAFHESEPRVIILSGHPGIGKSYIALKSAQNPATNSLFQIKIWITATTVELLISGLVSLINTAGDLMADFKMPLQKIIELTLELCSRHRCFLVFDDVTKVTSDIVEQIVTAFDIQSMAVISTCIKGLYLCPGCEELPVDALSMPECFQLLEYIIKGGCKPRSTSAATEQARRLLWQDLLSNSAAVEAIVECALGRSPLGVSLLGQLFVSEMSLEAVKKIFSNLEGGIATKSRQVFAHRHSGLETTVRYLLKPIQHNKRLLSLLYAISLLSPNGIPLRLLTTFGGSHEEPLDAQKFMKNELAAIESVGLVFSMVSGSSYGQGEEREKIVYVMVHQLTQMALRKVLKRDFGIVPIEVCEEIMSGISRDQRCDYFPAIKLGQCLTNTEEAFKWIDCVLFSSLAPTILEYSRDPFHSPPTVQKLMDMLLACCHMLFEINPFHVKRIYERLVYLGSLDVSETSMPLVFEDILLNLEEEASQVEMEGPNRVIEGQQIPEESYRVLFHISHQQKLALEPVCFLVGALLVSLGMGMQLQLLDDTCQSTIRDDGLPARADLVNMSEGLIKVYTAWQVSAWEGRKEDGLELIATHKKLLDPNERFYRIATQRMSFSTASSLLYLHRYQESLAILSPLREEYQLDDNKSAWHHCSEVEANIWEEMGRPQEALEILHRALDYTSVMYGDGTNQRKLADIYSQLGSCYMTLKDCEMAESYLLQFEDICGRIGNLGLFLGMWIICQLYYEWGKYSIAWEWTMRRWRDIGGEELGLTAYAAARANTPNYLWALGPQIALRETQQLDLLKDCASLLKKTKASGFDNSFVTILTLQARTSAWAGDASASWRYIQEKLPADKKGLGNALIWQYNVQYLSSALQVVRSGLSLTHDETIAADEKEIIESLRDAWKECLQLSEAAMASCDVGWHYEYARVLLWLAEEQDFYEAIKGSHAENDSFTSPREDEEPAQLYETSQSKTLGPESSHALGQKAIKVLHNILAADVEKTEWTDLASQLLTSWTE